MLTDKENLGVIVTGATGWIGRNICQYLQQLNCRVIACDLREQAGPWDDFITLDISQDSGLPDCDTSNRHFPQGVSYALIHCAGYAHRAVETDEEIKRFWAINAEGTRRVLEWASAIKVQKFVYLSSIAFYDWSVPEVNQPLVEGSLLSGKTDYAKSKLAGENYVKESSLDTRIVRLATVFGDGDIANFSKLAKALKNKRFILPGQGAAKKSVISVAMASRCIAEFALIKDPKHKLVNLGLSKAPTLKEICEAYHCSCGFPRPILFPFAFLRFFALFGDLAAKLKPNFPLTSLNVQKLKSSTWVDCSKAGELFPELADTTFADALEQSKGFYRDV